MHRFGRLTRSAAPFLMAAALLFTQGDSHAVVQPTAFANRPALETATGVGVRPHVGVAWDRMPRTAARAWTTFMAEAGPSWRASWDTATGVPSRMFGVGIAAPGSVSSAQTGAVFARAFLERHLALLAPGASIDDFALAGNDLERGMRTIGFYQYHQGLRVIGGQVSFRFKNDRLFVIGSEALPDVAARAGKPTVAEDDATEQAIAWVLRDSGATAEVRSYEGPFILPLIGHAKVRAYRTVMKATVDARDPIGRWDVYVDAFDGKPVAREQTLRFADATVSFNVGERHGGGSRLDYPAQGMSALVNAAEVTSSDTGLVSWASTQGAPATLRARGPLVGVINDAGAAAENQIVVSPGGGFVWDARSTELIDSQLSTFIHGSIVKAYSRRFAPTLGFLDEQLRATVNIDDSCNAFSDGETINFFQSSSQCANTGQLADVIYHEFGHSLHGQSIIPGVGSFDGGFSEGLSDYLAATIQNDNGMGRGFFRSEEPLRDIDPVGSEARWPEDAGEVHVTGLIFGGAMWDLRKSLIETYGQDEGVRKADTLFYAAVRRASNTPTTYIEVLAADDDDGDLTNGTPNECAINQTFGAHGLRAVSAELTPLAVEAPNQDGYRVELAVRGLSATCAGDGVASATVAWKPRAATTASETITMTEVAGSPDTYEGVLPEQPAGQVINFQVEVTFDDATSKTFPANPADPWYEFFVGEIEELYCTDFETEDPFANGWAHGLTSGEMQDGADDWQWGAPFGVGGDPGTAWSGTNVIGNDLGGDEFNGQYQSDKVNYVESPVIEVGAYSDVHLQYRRWLNVEDSFFDQGSIYANGMLAWRNLDSDQGNSSSTHHQDGEWRFHDVPLSPFVTEGTVQIKYEIASDAGLELGGWTIDDFCIVAISGSVCGDGEVTGNEECDDGAGNNDIDPDACRATCRFPTCGDGIVDSGETCDDGNDVNEDDCANTCEGAFGAEGGGGCGCDAGGNLPPASGILLVGAVVALLRRRRRAHD